MQLLWLQNPSAVELTADVEFHSFGMRGMSKLVGRIFGGRSSGVRLGAADGFARVELSAPLRPERLRPKAQLTNVERALRPSSARSRRGRPSSTCSLRATRSCARRPRRRGVRSTRWSSRTTSRSRRAATRRRESCRRGSRRSPRVAALFSQLYDSPLDSMIWRLDDGRGATLAHGGAMHDSSPVSLKPGAKYKASVLLRHPDAAQLEKLKDLPLLLEMPLAKALDCPVHAEREAAAKLGAKPIDDGWLRRGGVREIYVATPNASVPSWVAPGDVLVGQLEVDSGEAAVTSLPLSYAAAAPEEGGGGRRRGGRRGGGRRRRRQGSERGAAEGEARAPRRAEQGGRVGGAIHASRVAAARRPRRPPAAPPRAPRPRRAAPPDGAAEAAWRAEQVETAAGRVVGAVDAAALAAYYGARATPTTPRTRRRRRRRRRPWTSNGARSAWRCSRTVRRPRRRRRRRQRRVVGGVVAAARVR